MAEDKQQGKLRSFTHKQRQKCWEKADIVPGRDPNRWRKDRAGNVVAKKLIGCSGCMCHEYDHIIPYAEGGETEVSNCQILQSRVNLAKGKKLNLTASDLQQLSCAKVYTDAELDLVELSIYGNINTDNVKCRAKNIRDFIRSEQSDPCNL